MATRADRPPIGATNISLRLRAEDRARLEELCSLLNCSQADAIRGAIAVLRASFPPAQADDSAGLPEALISKLWPWRAEEDAPEIPEKF